MCYLGVKEFSGLLWEERLKLLHAMAAAGVLFLQLTGGEPLIDRLFPDVYRLAEGRVSICKVGRDEQINLVAEGVGGLRRLGAIADSLLLRTGGCSGCQLSGACTVCRPLAKRYQQARAPLHTYCQHGQDEGR
jgi:hypothetical protein